MKKRDNELNNVGEVILAVIFAIFFMLFLFTIAIGFSWGIVALFVWLICLCFKIQFSFSVATGIWLIVCCLVSLFKK